MLSKLLKFYSMAARQLPYVHSKSERQLSFGTFWVERPQKRDDDREIYERIPIINVYVKDKQKQRSLYDDPVTLSLSREEMADLIREVKDLEPLLKEVKYYEVIRKPFTL